MRRLAVVALAALAVVSAGCRTGSQISPTCAATVPSGADLGYPVRRRRHGRTDDEVRTRRRR